MPWSVSCFSRTSISAGRRDCSSLASSAGVTSGTCVRATLSNSALVFFASAMGYLRCLGTGGDSSAPGRPPLARRSGGGALRRARRELPCPTGGGFRVAGVWLVLHLDAKKRGSLEQQLVALGRRLREERIPATMVFARPPAPFPAEALREAGVTLRHLDFDLPSHRVARQLWSWMRRERPQLVHFHFIDPYSLLVAAARLSGARVLVHDHLCLSRGRPLRVAGKRLRAFFLNGLFHERLAVSAF